MRPAPELLGLVALLLPATAAACPACAREGSPEVVAWLIGAMVVAPLCLGAVIFRTARRLEREDDRGAP